MSITPTRSRSSDSAEVYRISIADINGGFYGDRTRNVVGRLIRLVMDTMLLPTVCIIGVTVMYLVYVSRVGLSGTDASALRADIENARRETQMANNDCFHTR